MRSLNCGGDNKVNIYKQLKIKAFFTNLFEKSRRQFFTYLGQFSVFKKKFKIFGHLFLVLIVFSEKKLKI